MRILTILAVLCFSVTAPSALAQADAIDPLSIPSGAQARISGPANARDYVKLTVIGVTPDSVRYRLNGEANSRALSWQNVRRMDVSGGSHSNAFRDVGVGVLLGVVGAGLAGAATRDPYVWWFGTYLLGAVGGIAGGVIGIVARSENWIPVSLPHNAAFINAPREVAP